MRPDPDYNGSVRDFFANRPDRRPSRPAPSVRWPTPFDAEEWVQRLTEHFQETRL